MKYHTQKTKERKLKIKNKKRIQQTVYRSFLIVITKITSQKLKQIGDLKNTASLWNLKTSKSQT